MFLYYYFFVGSSEMVPNTEPIFSTQTDESNRSKFIDSINYVFPVESFNDFKVILPKTKLELKTMDGNKVVISRCDIKNDNRLNVVSSNATSKYKKSSLSVLEALTRERMKSKSGLRSEGSNICSSKKVGWDRESACYVHYCNNKKFVIDGQSGKISCYRVNSSNSSQSIHSKPQPVSFPVIENEEYLNEIRHENKSNFFVPSCYSITSVFTKELLSRYKSTSSCVKRRLRHDFHQSGRLTLKRLKTKYTCEKNTENSQYWIFSTKFGSFMQKKKIQTGKNIYIKTMCCVLFSS